MKSWFKQADGSLRNGWKILAFMLIAAAWFGLTGFARTVIPPEIKAYIPSALLFALGVSVATGVALRLEKSSWASIGIALNGRFVRQLGAGTLLGLGMILTVTAIAWAAGAVELTRVPDVAPAAIARMALVFLCVAFAEEMMFRGFPLQRAMRGLGQKGGMLLFAVLFTVGHVPGNTDMDMAMFALAMANIFVVAYLLSYAYLRSGSLALPIGVHLGWNWMQAVLGFGVSGGASKGWWTPSFHGAEWISGGAFGLEASVPALLLELLVLAVLVRMAPLGAAAKA